MSLRHIAAGQQPTGQKVPIVSLAAVIAAGAADQAAVEAPQVGSAGVALIREAKRRTNDGQRAVRYTPATVVDFRPTTNAGPISTGAIGRAQRVVWLRGAIDLALAAIPDAPPAETVRARVALRSRLAKDAPAALAEAAHAAAAEARLRE